MDATNKIDGWHDAREWLLQNYSEHHTTTEICAAMDEQINAIASQPAAVSAPSDERAAFDAWVRKEYEPGQTPNFDAEWVTEAWPVWQAARAAAPVSGPSLWVADDGGSMVVAMRTEAEWREFCDAMQPVEAYPGYRAALPWQRTAKARPTDDELWDATLRDRDTYHEWADKLAEGIAKHFGIEIGEHSNHNLPWAEALEHIESVPSAAPVSGQGASIGDDPEFREHLENYAFQSRLVYSPEAWKRLITYIDSRPRSEDSRKIVATVIKTGAERQWMSEALGDLPDGAYSLCLATPPKADNE